MLLTGSLAKLQRYNFMDTEFSVVFNINPLCVKDFSVQKLIFKHLCGICIN